MPKRNAKKSRRILFLCTGNYYRSRFAEIFFNWQAQQRGLSWQAESRGLAIDGYNYGPISRHTLATLRRTAFRPTTRVFHYRLPKPI